MKSRRRVLPGWAPAGAAVALVLAAYAPILRLPPVAEDLQWALRGATVLRSPALVLHPFHQHLRPLGDAFFATSVALFDARWAGYRAGQLVAAGVLSLAGWALARRLLGGGWAATLVVPLWLVCPLVTEVFCVTNQVKQMLLGAGVLGVLCLRLGDVARWRRVAVAGCAVVAAAAKEEWVVLPVLVLLQDLVWRGMPWRRAWRQALPWVAAVTVYLGGYGALVAFQARGFYEASAATVAGKAVATLASLWHLADPVPLDFVAYVRGHPWSAAIAVALTAAVLVALAVWRSRPGLFAAAVVAARAAPTAVSALQAGRYLLLPWLFALLAVTAAGIEAWRRLRLRPALATAGLALLVAGF